MSKTRLVRFNSNDVLFSEGEETRELYIIRSGSVRVSTTKNGELFPIANLGTGSFVGEMSFISGLPRSATVTAIEPVIANLISVEVLESGPFGINDWAVNIARVLAERIRKTTMLLGEYRHINSEPMQEDRTQLLNEFGHRDEPSDHRVTIFLRGYVTGTHLNELKNILRNYSVQGYRSAVIDFADVPDVDKEVLDFFSQLSVNNNASAIEVSIRNVQLIRNRIRTIEGIESLIEQSHLPMQRVTRHDYLIRQDEMDDDMYVVKNGRFAITRTVDDEEILLGYAEQGDVIGEMNLLTEGTRTANVRAEQTSVVYRISAVDFEKNSYRIPGWFMEIVRVLVYRLRQTNSMLEREVRRQDYDDGSPVPTVPICIKMDSANPGTIILHHDVAQGNLEFLAAMVNLLIKHEYPRIAIDLREINSIDHAVIQYLLKLHVYLQKRGQILKLTGERKEILRLLKQYDIDLPEKRVG